MGGVGWRRRGGEGGRLWEESRDPEETVLEVEILPRQSCEVALWDPELPGWLDT